MGRGSAQKTAGAARIRFVVIDAEIPDGDIGSVTQVIQNALRTPTTVVQRNINVHDTRTIAHQAAEHVETEDEYEDVEDVEAPPTHTSKPRGPRRPPPAPNVIEIDMNSDVSLASFANGKDSKSQHKKYLIAAAWLKEHRQISAVTADHIYTCFRSNKWPTNIADFWQPLRGLKAKKFFSTNDEGGYEINHIGLDYVQKLGGNHGAN